MTSVTLVTSHSSAESLQLRSAQTSPWPTPSRKALLAVDYLDVDYIQGRHRRRTRQSSGASLSSDGSRRTSLSSVSNCSTAGPEGQPVDAKYLSCFVGELIVPKRGSSCGSLSDSGSIEFVESDSEEIRNDGHRYQSVPQLDPQTAFEPNTPSSASTAHPSPQPPPPPPCYPNCDASVWLRSCEHEIIEPISGTQSGQIPLWLHGSLLRNGPGNLRVGTMHFKHLFDSSALLHRFAVADGRVTYQCRFIRTDTYKRNQAAQRIVVSEFGTSSVPDPCHTIFQRISAAFRPGEWSDNAMISIYPFGDEYFAFTEYPVIHSIDVQTLATRRKLNVMDYTGVMSHTSHPHVLADGSVYNLGMTVRANGPHYNILRFPPKDSQDTADPDAMFRAATIVATVPSRWKLHPGYMHTFGMTANYFVIVEQPLSVSVPEMIRSQLRSQPMAGNFRWFADQPTCVYLVRRADGQLAYTFEADSFFYLHIINAYEVDGGDGGVEYVVLDICSYRDPGMLDCMYIEAMQTMQQNPDYARMFRGRPMRFVLPLQRRAGLSATMEPKRTKSMLQLKRSFSLSGMLAKLSWPTTGPKLSRSASEHHSAFRYRSMADALNGLEANAEDLDEAVEAVENLVQLDGSVAEAFYRDGSEAVFCKPEQLCDLGCETPRINYEQFMGRAYRYFYAISSDVDAENPGTLIKVDVVQKTRLTWCEPNCYPSEPVFVPSPNCSAEDDGVVLAAMVWGNYDENRAGLLVLCARTWMELGRAEFRTPGPVPKCLHGWFAPANK